MPARIIMPASQGAKEAGGTEAGSCSSDGEYSVEEEELTSKWLLGAALERSAEPLLVGVPFSFGPGMKDEAPLVCCPRAGDSRPQEPRIPCLKQ